MSERPEQTEAEFFKSMAHHFLSLANANLVACGPDVATPSLGDAVSLPGGLEVFVDLTDIVDIEGEIASKEKELKKLETLVAAKQKKLKNNNFIERAPEDIVQKEKGGFMELQKRALFILIQLNTLLKMKLERMG